jgi:hypothetical protein
MLIEISYWGIIANLREKVFSQSLSNGLLYLFVLIFPYKEII